MTFLSITVSLASVQLNKGCSSSRLFKESQHSYLTDPGGETLHVYTSPLPKKQAHTHKWLQWEDFTVLHQGLFSRADGTQRCQEHNTKGQTPSPLVLNSFATFIQCIAGSSETFLPPVRSTWLLTACSVPLDHNTIGCWVSPLPIKALRDTSSSCDTSKRRVFMPDWLEKCEETLPGPACSLLCLLVGGHLSSHGPGTGN